MQKKEIKKVIYISAIILGSWHLIHIACNMLSLFTDNRLFDHISWKLSFSPIIDFILGLLSLPLCFVAVVMFLLDFLEKRKNRPISRVKEHVKTGIYGFVIFTLLLLYQVELMYGPLTMIPIAFVYFTGIPLLLILIIVASRKRMITKAIRFTVLLIVLVLALTAARFINDAKSQSSKQNGDIIIAALLQYHADHMAYPDSLNVLVPNYLQSLPKPTMGFLLKQDFWYRKRDSEDSYTISFSEKGWHTTRYDSQYGKWITHD